MHYILVLVLGLGLGLGLGLVLGLELVLVLVSIQSKKWGLAFKQQANSPIITIIIHYILSFISNKLIVFQHSSTT